MKKLFLFLIISLQLFAETIKTPLLTYDEGNAIATIKVDKIDVGMSGFVVHKLSSKNGSILKEVEVVNYDETSKIATLKVKPYYGLKNNALPVGKWKIEVGDVAVLAFGYDRALLIAPNEEIYYKISSSVKIHWLHPDIFATILSFRGHPTPLKGDFDAMSNTVAVGLVFIYLEKKVYTLDSKSFKILSVTDAPLEQKETNLPFYTRIQEIKKAWWGAGSKEVEDYSPYYFELLTTHNRGNKKLHDAIKSADEKFHYLLKEFEIKE